MKQTITKAIVAGVAAIVSLANFSFAAPAQGGGTDFNNNQNPLGVGVNVSGGDNLNESSSLIDTIKSFINLVLGFLGLISLVILLYGGFQMVTAAGDEKKYESGFKIMKQAGIGLLFIGLAALFVQLVFWILGSIA